MVLKRATTKEELLAIVSPHGQQHLLAFWESLTRPGKERLAGQIAGIDFAQIDRLFRHIADTVQWAELAARAEPPPAFRLGGSSSAGKASISPAAARRRGAEALAAGEVGVVLVAGGQGTRLGFDHPKGMYPIGPISGDSLFQILLQKILARAIRFDSCIPLYLMTSPATHEETLDYLAEHAYFGLGFLDVRIFCQGTMPAVDSRSGKLLLADRGSLFLSPDGHGGMLAAAAASGALDEMQRRGLKHMFYLQVDNPLAPVCDPEFIGYHVLTESELSTLVVAKRHSRDKLGNVALIDGRLRIIEYSDLNNLPDAVVDRRSADGTPVFWAGNTGIHVFDVAFLARAAADGDALPFHSARKEVPFIDESGRRVEPPEPNAIKFERFIFDLLPAARTGIVVESDRDATFAPVKNGPDDNEDTPQTVQAQMMKLHRSWIRQAGGSVADDVPVEFNALFAQDADEAAARIAPGTVVVPPHCFTEPNDTQ